jgi:hypothetical protein
MREIAAGQREPHRLGAGREQQRVIGMAAPLRGLDLPAPRIDGRDARAKLEIDLVLAIELGRAQGNPVFGSAAGKIVLGEVRPA